jgi:hypothetical protein
MELFDSTKRHLYDILKDVKSGKIQLPDFQRGWIWDDFRIRGLLASIAKSFPIGAVMLLETGNEDIRFKTRPVESVETNGGLKNPEELILDGQQRITSLYQTIMSNKIVATKNEKGQAINRWYYIDMQKALDTATDLEEAIISINENKQITRDFGREIVLDLSKEENEYQQMIFPIHMIDEHMEWMIKFYKYWNYESEKVRFCTEFISRIVDNFSHYQLPVICLTKENTKEAVCQVFEKVNTGGVSLNVFELLTATYASDNFNLRENWAAIHTDIIRFKVLKKTENTDYLQSITLLSTYNKRIQQAASGSPEDRLPSVSCKRKDVLSLSLQEYQKYFEVIHQGYIKAAKLLEQNGIFNFNDVPYSTQFVPLSAIFAVLGNDADNISVRNKIMQWFWCGVFGELYGGANETRYALDLPQVVDWIRHKIDQPKTIYDANFNPSRINTLRTRNSAAYKGINVLLMQQGARDWIDGQTITFTNYFSESIDIHHIFPQKWCENKIPRSDFDCIVNKTPLSARTNRIIGGDGPSKYLPEITKKLEGDNDGLRISLQSHFIDPDCLMADDFYAFFTARKNKLLQLIGIAMGKPVDLTISIPETETNEDDSLEVSEDSIDINNG